MTSANSTTTERSSFFIESISSFDISREYADIHLTNYRLDQPKVQKVIQACSPKRLITIDDCLLQPGHGEGVATFNGQKYDVTYAWRGLTEWDINLGTKDYDQVLNWTVRLEAQQNDRGFKKQLETSVRDIYLEEGGKLEYELTRKEWLETTGCTPATLGGYRKHLQESAQDYHSSGRARFLEDDTFEDLITSLDQLYSPEGIEEAIARIKGKRTLTFQAPFIEVQKVEPWRVLLPRKRKTKQ